MKFTRIKLGLAALLVGALVACSGGTGGTFSIVDGVYDVPPTHGYEAPGGSSTASGSSSGGSSSSSGGSSGRVDGGTSTDGGVKDSGSGSRPVACGTTLSCFAGETTFTTVYDCSLYTADGRIVDKDGNSIGTWTASGTTILIQGKTDAGSVSYTCSPKSTSGDAGK